MKKKLLIATAVVAVALAACGGTPQTPQPTPEPAPSVETAALELETEPDAEPDVELELVTDAGGINAQSFALIRNGMSVDEVQELIGVAPSSETTTETLGITSTVIMWMGSGLESITVLFTNGNVTSTTQMSLRGEPQVEVVTAGGVNMDTFVSLRNGMSISEVQDAIGVPPTSETSTEMLGITTTMIMWMGDGLSSITVTFTDGYVSMTSQLDL
ncbi:MAG: hypothetical protein FWE20_04835 [Defluviitaleaceae bacterium]|nr:hypothetical protein [Defluviitaleaceae bacterium]